jgi:hypothetical protein
MPYLFYANTNQPLPFQHIHSHLTAIINTTYLNVLPCPCTMLLFISIKKLDILPIPCQYMNYELMNFILNNQENFQTNSSIHSRNKHHLHRPNANLSYFQKSRFYAGIRIFNRLPLSLISLKNEKTKFKATLIK